MISGTKPTLLSVSYIRADKKNNTEECFEVIYKDDMGNVKIAYEPPMATIYIVKPKYRTYNYCKPQEEISNMDKVRCKISEIRYKIAEAMGEQGTAFIEQCYANKDYSSINRLYSWQFAFGCDFQPEFYYLRDWYNKYKYDGIVKLSKSFMDIELSILDYTPDMDKLSSSAYSEVNLITQYFDSTNEMITLVLRPWKPSRIGTAPDEYDYRYGLYERQLKDHNTLFSNVKSFTDDMNNEFKSMYGDISYNIREYENEIDLIADAFKLIHKRKPNFSMAWNMRFDIQYLVERIKVLGYDPRSIICDPTIASKRCFFQVDTFMFDIKNQSDYFHCSSYTHFLCQMRLYASIRKSQSALKYMSLNYIANKVLGDNKVDYESETNIKLFPYHDWIKFIKYNIKDVLLQVGIERKSNDVMTYYSRSHANITPYNKIFRETHLVRNIREQSFEEDGLVQFNNINIINLKEDVQWLEAKSVNDEDEVEVTFKGAIMANPIYNDNVGITMMGKRSNCVFRNAIDYDMGAFYPSIKISSNMDASTLLYKASFYNEEFTSGEYINNSLNTDYFEKDKNGKTRRLDITGEAVNSYVSNNVLTFAHSYLGMPTASEIYRDIKKSMGQ